MTIPYTGFEAACEQSAIQMLSSSTNFQALVGAVDATHALGSIIEDFGGFPSTNGTGTDFTATNGALVAIDGLLPYGVISIGEISRSSLGINAYERTGRATFRIGLPANFKTLTPPAAMRNARNVMAGIRADLEAQRQAVGCFAVFVIDVAGPWVEDEIKADFGFIFFDIFLDFIA